MAPRERGRSGCRDRLGGALTEGAGSTSLAPPGEFRTQAEEALRIARIDPATARRLALEVLSDADEIDVLAAGMAEEALGVVASESNDVPGGLARLARSVALGAASGDQRRTCEARITLAAVLAVSGDLSGALAQLDLVPPKMSGLAGARAQCQRALVLLRLGRYDEALEGYRGGLAAMRRVGHVLGEAQVFGNRGILHAYCGRLSAAESDLERAERLYRKLGRPVEAACARHDLGFVAARKGDLPAAIRSFERARSEFSEHGVERPTALLDYGQVLLAARLVPEACEVARQAVAKLEEGGMGSDLAEALLLLAEARLAAGDADGAYRAADMARSSFVHQGRRGWAALAGYARLRCQWARIGGDSGAEEAEELIAELDRCGWLSAAIGARITAALVALDQRRLGAAESLLREAARCRRTGPAEVRLQAWHAQALLRDAQGRATGTQSALRAAFGVLEEHQAALGATELRVGAVTHARELSRVALRTAIASRRPSRVLAWAERTRAGTLRFRPVRPPDDAEMAEQLAELRTVVHEVHQAGVAGETTTALLRRQARLEDAIRRRSWHSGSPSHPAHTPPSVDDLSQVLGSRALLELVESDGMVWGVTVVAGRCRMRSLARESELQREAERLRVSLSRLARYGSEMARVAAARTLRASSHRLDRLLLGPVRHELGDRPLVVVPTGALHALAWASLPSLRGREVCVSPSAALWLQARRKPPPTTAEPCVLVAGPDVTDAASELRAIKSIRPMATALFPRTATVRRVTRALDGARLAHVIAHGTFRSDNPLFSSLLLADGPLTVYDLELLKAAPRRMIMSACNSGLSAVGAGDELMGLAATLQSLGTETLVASVGTVANDETRALMVELHRRSARGLSLAQALAESQEQIVPDGVSSALSFVCLGA